MKKDDFFVIFITYRGFQRFYLLSLNFFNGKQTMKTTFLHFSAKKMGGFMGATIRRLSPYGKPPFSRPFFYLLFIIFYKGIEQLHIEIAFHILVQSRANSLRMAHFSQHTPIRGNKPLDCIS